MEVQLEDILVLERHKTQFGDGSVGLDERLTSNAFARPVMYAVDTTEDNFGDGTVATRHRQISL